MTRVTPSPAGGSGGSSVASLVPTAVKTANYSAAASDYVPVDTTSGSVTIALPAAPADKTQIGIKHVVRGGTNTVSFTCGGSDVINKTGGSTSGTITLLNQSAVLQYKASTGVWYVVGGDLPLSQLDIRYQSGGSGYLSLRSDFALDPTSSVAALTTAIQSAINFCCTNGKSLDVGSDLWPINAALTIPGNLTLRGAGAGEVWNTVSNSNTTTRPGAAPWVTGGGFVQQTAATNVLSVTATGTTLHLRDLQLRFADAIAFNNTGHGLYAVPTALASGQPENGLAGCSWDNVVVFGHDGNHYAFYTVNMNYFTATQLRSYGGGGWYEEVNSAISAYGNGTLIQPYFALIAGGTAHGMHLKSGTSTFPGMLNLVTMIRPQVYATSVPGLPLSTAYSIPALGAGQKCYLEQGDPRYMNVFAPNMEPSALATVFGRYTTVLGYEYSSRAVSANTVFGDGALPGTPTGQRNTAVGYRAANVPDTAAMDNTAIGYQALTVTTGGNNTALGSNALVANVAGTNNTAVGAGALKANTSAIFNTAVGYNALTANTTGQDNTAVGFNALGANTTISGLVGVGTSALGSNTTGTVSAALGFEALKANTTGNQNVAVGYRANTANVSGSQNVAVGWEALLTGSAVSGATAVGAGALHAATGINNTAVGNLSAFLVSTGANNVSLGYLSLRSATTGSNNAVVGPLAGYNLVTGSSNTALGDSAGYTDGTTATTDNSRMTLIGEKAQATTSDVIVLGKAIATRPNMIFGGVGAAAAFGGGVGVFHIANAATVPSSNPTGGGVLYVTGGALTFRGSSGTVTTIGPA